jgi:hypothetical protein
VESDDEDDEASTLQRMVGSQHVTSFSASFSSSDSLDPPSGSSPLPSLLPSPPDGSTRIPVDLSARMQHSVDHLEAASQAVRLQIANKEQSDKATTATYERHVKAYAAWWATYQARVLNEDPTQVTIPAFPVTAAKATMFLEYTSTRPKVSTPFHCPMPFLMDPHALELAAQAWEL